MLQENERIRFAQILDAYPLPGGFGGDEQFVLRHLAEADQGWGGDGMLAKRSISLRQDQAISGTIANGHRSFRKDGQFLRRIMASPISDPILAIA